MKNKKVVVMYYTDDWHKETPFVSEPTRRSFEDWHERGLRNNIEFFRASMKWYDLETNSFEMVWAYRDGQWKKIKGPLSPDLIFDKIAGKRDYALFDWKMQVLQKTKIFNDPSFRTILDNKLSQYLILEEFMPKSFLATNRKELLGISQKIKSSKIVIKPIYGSGGFGIIIDEKEKALNKEISYPVFIQEFIKSEKGIPGFSKKDEISDLRMIFMNHKLVYALSRVAKEGSLFTNFHQGASAKLVPEEYIPNNVEVMAKKVADKLSIFPEANYSIDFIFTNEGDPVLVEINTTPGFDLLHIVGDEEVKDKNFKEFITILK